MSIPTEVPILSVGRHRSPRDGGCFMEVASFLAGERWSDHPRSVAPVVAALARTVNDLTSAEARCQLVPLIPAVIGTAELDPPTVLRIAAHCCRVGLDQGGAHPLLARVLRRAEALERADQTRRSVRWRLRRFTTLFAPRTAAVAALALAQAPPAQADAAMRGLLEEVIRLARAGRAHDDVPVQPDQWHEVCGLVGGR